MRNRYDLVDDLSIMLETVDATFNTMFHQKIR